MGTTELVDNYFKVPNGIFKIVKNTYNLSVLLYLLRCANGNGTAFPSYKNLAQGLMSRYKCMQVCKELQDSGYISIKNRFNTKRNCDDSNIFIINMEKILSDIEQANSGQGDEPCSLPTKPKLTEQQKDIIAEKRATKYPEIAHRAEHKNGFEVTKDNEKIVTKEATRKKKPIIYKVHTPEN